MIRNGEKDGIEEMGMEDARKEITGLRKKLDEIDMELISLLEKRFNITEEIGEIKVKSGLPIAQKTREEEILKGIDTRLMTSNYRVQIKALYEALFEISKKSQSALKE